MRENRNRASDQPARAAARRKTAGLKNNAWFVGFAPRRNPEIVVAVVVQGGGYGAESAAPIVRDVVKAYYDKKQGFRRNSLPRRRCPDPLSRRTSARTAEGGALIAKPQPAAKPDVKPLPTAAIIPTTSEGRKPNLQP